jgi:predicted aspartyl protease
MIRYRYNQQVNPPAPFVHVTLGTMDAVRRTEEVPAQLDPGADKTVVPSRLIDILQVSLARLVPTAGLGSQVHQLSAFYIEIAIRGQKPVVAEVLASSEEPYVLLGRDVLNSFRIILDGPQQFLEIH